ncbi:MAG: TonB-dependent receptor [Betaproteobacteria bacterium]|nr:TonB-dependent receptor [Betaproteobacteria bacterium]
MRTPSIGLAAGLAAALASFAPAARSQSDNEALVVTAVRFPERRLDAPVGMTVITAKDIARDTARTLPELLEHLGGLYIRDNSGDPNRQLDLRGFGITGDQNTLVLLDGIRLNENDLSTTNLAAIPLQSIERIEILRGSGAVLYGGGATGGVINIITKGPQPNRRDAYGYAGYGAYGSAEARASVNLAGERFGALFSGSHYESDNYRVNNRVRQDDATGELRYGGGDASLAVKFGTDSQRLQLPGTRNEIELASDPRGTDTPGDWSTRDGNFVTLLGRRWLGDVELAADLGYRDQLATANYQSLGAYYRAALHSTTFSPRLRWQASPYGIATSLVAGIDLGYWGYGRQFAASPASIGSPSATDSATQDASAFYAQYNVQVTHAAKVTLGWRTERVTNALEQGGFAPSSQSQTRSPHAGEAGLQYALTPKWTAFGRVGTSFRIATVDENAFTSTGNLLEPQTARNRDAGLEYRANGMHLRADAYAIDLENEIYFSPLVVPFGANTNLSPTRRTGIELSGEWHATHALDLAASLIYQTAKFKYGVYGGVDVAGRDVPLVPRALANLRASWRLPQKTRLDGTLTYVGHQRYDNDQANTFPQMMPAYALADLKLSRKVGEWTLAASVNNLFDKHYYSYAIVNSFGCSTPICAYPEAGRTWFASAERRFR